MIEAEKQCLVQEFVPHLRIKGFTDAVLHGLAGSDEAMKCQATPVSSLQASMAFEVNSVP